MKLKSAVWILAALTAPVFASEGSNPIAVVATYHSEQFHWCPDETAVSITVEIDGPTVSVSKDESSISFVRVRRAGEEIHTSQVRGDTVREVIVEQGRFSGTFEICESLFFREAQGTWVVDNPTLDVSGSINRNDRFPLYDVPLFRAHWNNEYHSAFLAPFHVRSLGTVDVNTSIRSAE